MSDLKERDTLRREEDMLGYALLKEMHTTLMEHIKNEPAEIAEAVAAALARLVPDGDIEAHRRAHEAMIAEANDKAALFRSVRDKVVSGGVWAMLGGITAACWYWIKDHVR